MTLTLREKQSLFVRLQALFIEEAYARGYELTEGEGWRPPEMVKIYAEDGRGSGRSLHPDRLAKDWNLFKDGVWLKSTEDHRPLGEWWEKLNPLCRWGGRFGDGNHYSLEHEGRK
jgi:hypothetical protein